MLIIPPMSADALIWVLSHAAVCFFVTSTETSRWLDFWYKNEKQWNKDINFFASHVYQVPTSCACWNQAGAMLTLPGFNHPPSALKEFGETLHPVQPFLMRIDLWSIYRSCHICVFCYLRSTPGARTKKRRSTHSSLDRQSAGYIPQHEVSIIVLDSGWWQMICSGGRDWWIFLQDLCFNSKVFTCYTLR